MTSDTQVTMIITAMAKYFQNRGDNYDEAFKDISNNFDKKYRESEEPNTGKRNSEIIRDLIDHYDYPEGFLEESLRNSLHD